MSRRKTVIVVLGAVILSAVLSWVIGSQVRSPAEVASRTAAPEASPILVPAEDRVLSTDIVTRGTARFGSPQQLSLPPSALKPLAGVVGDVPALGSELREGDLVLTASGRPIFLLEGRQPAFRDLGPGIAGDDVLQLEEALVRMGFDPGPADGTYDDQTEAAVAAWYRDEGFTPFEATDDQLSGIRALEAHLANARLDVLVARTDVRAAEADLNAARGAQAAAANSALRGPDVVAVALAEVHANNRAAAAEESAMQIALNALIAGTRDAPATAAEIAAAQADRATAQANAASVRVAGENAVNAAQALVGAGPGSVSAAQADADAANRAATAEVSSKQAALNVLLAGTPSTPGTPPEIAAAQSDLTAAQSSQSATLLAGQQSVADAQAVLNGAAAALAAAQAAALASDQAAVAEVAAKQAALDAVLADPGSTPAEIAAAQADLAAAQANQTATQQAGAQSVAAAQAVLNGAPAALAAAQAAALAADQQAAADIAAKQATLNLLLAGTLPIPASPSEIAAAQADLASAQANQDATRLAGEQAVAAAQAANGAADTALAAAQAEADAANDAADAEVAANQVVLDALVDGPPIRPATPAEIAAAEAALATAQANAEITRLAGERTLAEARSVARLAGAGSAGAAASVAAAETALATALEALDLRYGPADLVELDLGLARRRAGIQLPADEVIFVSSVPLRVTEVAVVRGDALSGAVLTVTDAIVVIDGSLALSDAPLVTTGATVVIDEADLGISATGAIRRVAETPGTNGVDGFHVYFEILVDESPPNLVGASVRLTIPIESSGGSVLAVPVSAVSLAADGSSRVQVQRDGALEFVTVEAGLAADGFVGVTPLRGTLEPGDLVVIGFENRGTTPGA